MSIALKPQEQVDRVLARLPLLQEVCEREPDMLQVFLSAAKHEDSNNRWRMYSQLKRIGTHYVGFDARNPELATCQHYEAMVDAIDALLPDECMDEIEEGEYDDEEY